MAHDLVQASYAHCAALTRRQGSSFAPAFCLLPRAQRQAMNALYAFMRITDDLGDEPGDPEGKRERLAAWRTALHRALQGDDTHPIHPAVRHLVEQYAVPPEYLDAAIDGVESDLREVRMATFTDLRLYCYRVASVVGLACIHIWGFKGPDARKMAEDAGIAFQLTNILRDLGEDAARGRIYLPEEDLARFGYSADRLAAGVRDQAYGALIRFQVERARSYYASAWPLEACLPPAGRAVFLLMARTYRSLLDEMERRDFDVFSRRVRLSRWRKLMLMLGVVPARLGLGRTFVG